ncbi:MAG: 30S ribosomal protein S2 [Bacillus subtilis]|nr:30S ribosomal protein S2 [Bacillus subtilis]
MGVISMKSLLEAGVHFGHQTQALEPEDEASTSSARATASTSSTCRRRVDCLDSALQVHVRQSSRNGGKVLFVGTKKQAQEPIRDEATRAGQYYVDNRWLGGTLTNFKTIKKSHRATQGARQDGERRHLRAFCRRRKSSARAQGSANAREDPRRHQGHEEPPAARSSSSTRARKRIAVLEARKLGIPVVGDRRHQLRPRMTSTTSSPATTTPSVRSS